MKADILNRIGINSIVYEVYCFAQRVGNQDEFIFYTLSNEFPSEKPHCHLCVQKDNKDYLGKVMKNDSNLRSIAKIILRPDCRYSTENLEIVSDNNFSKKQRKMFVDFLNAKSKFSRNQTNGEMALSNYEAGNDFPFKYFKEYENWQENLEA